MKKAHTNIKNTERGRRETVH